MYSNNNTHAREMADEQGAEAAVHCAIYSPRFSLRFSLFVFQCTTLPSGSLPLLVRFTQDAGLASRTLQQYQQRVGHPWLGDINVLLAEVLQANKNATNSTAA